MTETTGRNHTKIQKKRSEKAGLLPGTLVHIGKVHSDTTTVSYTAFNAEQIWEQDINTISECPLPAEDRVLWVNINGVSDTATIEEVGKCFSLHPLLLEDVVNTQQRPKVEEYGEYLFIVLKMLFMNESANVINSEQVSLVLGPNYVISFQEAESQVFELVRERIRNSKGRIRQMGADYVAYSLIDAIIDNYFDVLEQLGEKIDLVEEKLVSDPTNEILQTIHIFKREMIYVRKAVWPVREVLNNLEHGESALINETTVVYVRDAYDHTIQIIETMETYRDMLSSMMDIYLSSISYRMNEIMKVLTIIATLFIPLTFIVGLYGMNFKYMPELSWPWGYPLVLIVMLAVIVYMLIYFRRKRWI